MNRLTLIMPYANPHVLGWIVELKKTYLIDIFCVHSVDKFRKGYFEEYDHLEFINYKFKNKDYNKLFYKSIKNADFLISLGMFDLHFLRALLIINSKTKIYVMSEPFNPVNSREKFLIRNLYCKIIRFLSQNISFLCIGASTVKNYYQKLGFKNNNFYNFGYFPETNIMNPKISKSEKIKFLFVGQLIPRKGINVLINYLKYLEVNFKGKFEFTIVGDGVLNKYLKDNIKDYKLDSCKYLGLISDQKVINSLYLYSDVLFVPSNFDGWGAIINEGISKGLIILSSNKVFASNSLVENYKNGFIFDNNNLAELFNFTNHIFDKKDNLYLLKAFSINTVKEWNYRNAAVSFENLLKNKINYNKSLLKPI